MTGELGHMWNKIFAMKKAILLLLLTMILPAGTIRGEDPASIHPSMDALEWKLELDRHQILAALKACVLETGVQRAPQLSGAYNISEKEVALIYTAIADLMYRAVRIGGMPCTGLPWRWSYGWPKCNDHSGQTQR